MIFEEGDILQKGAHFYRIYLVDERKKELVFNKVFWHPNKNRLEIFHDYEFCKFDDVGDGKMYTLIKKDDPTVQQALEIVKRKYKLKKLNG